jgi:hypothetical protein
VPLTSPVSTTLDGSSLRPESRFVNAGSLILLPGFGRPDGKYWTKAPGEEPAGCMFAF